MSRIVDEAIDSLGWHWTQDETGEWKHTKPMNWIKEFDGLKLVVPIITHENQPDASYEIIIQRRPAYCDRGDWLIYMDGRNDIDACDGFPRYFIGSEDEVKHQMEQWLSRREAYRKTL